MIEFYPQIKYVPYAIVALLSGALFALRGVACWPARAGRALPVRWTSYAIDTALLTAALMLLTILPGRCSPTAGWRSSWCCWSAMCCSAASH